MSKIPTRRAKPATGKKTATDPNSNPPCDDSANTNAAELADADNELAFQQVEKQKRAEELLVANKELAYQNEQKGKRAAELVIANEELAFQKKEKGKRAAELIINNNEHAVENEEIAKQSARLKIENVELVVQNETNAREISDYKHALDESCIVAMTDDHGIIKHVNLNFCKITGYEASELVGRDHRVLNSGCHSKEFMEVLWTTIMSGKIWKGEMKNKTKTGKLFWVDTTIVPFLDQQGKPYQFAAISTDLNKRKTAEEEVRVLNHELEKRVRERTEELESFSYSVSHDLRAPLRAINGYARMYKSKYCANFDTEATRLVNNIVNSAEKMGNLIDDLLTFSRLGRREMQRVLIPVDEIVRNICAELKNESVWRDIEFIIADLPSVKADNTGIKQVWQNLISNAIKYTKHKEKALIEISFEENDNEIIYCIKDNGAGFDMRYISKLFTIFQRLHSEEEFDGTGVGLAIVQRIIHKHGGRVWAESKLNEETKFYFSLNKS